MGKPHYRGEEYYKDKMSSVLVRICGNCFKDDDQLQCETVEWIQCVSCMLWVHLACIHTDTENYLCQNCRLIQNEKCF